MILILLFFTFTSCDSANINTNEIVSETQVTHWWNPPDSKMMIEDRGYPVEVHEIPTEDGYLLSAFRIPYGRKGRINGAKPPVILQHGILCSSDCWTIMSPESGIAYRLADSGYDVWVANNRGFPYSVKHKTVPPSSQKFWNYSVHELGYYDLPGIIDYVINKTSFSKVNYVAHSQGTTQFFIMTSMRPKYNDKINLMVGMGPVAFLDHTHGLIKFLSYMSSFLGWMARSLRLNYILRHNILISFANWVICERAIFRPICNDIFFIITGFDSPQVNETILDEIANYCPTGASAKQLIHFSQLSSNGGKFSMFDYGSYTNQLVYNSSTPPEYNLKNIKARLAFYYGANDYIASPPEVERLTGILKNVIKSIKIKDELFNHLDFMWAKNVNELLNDDVIQTLNKYSL